MEFPEDVRYTKEHEWARAEGQARVRVGITDYAQDALGDVVYVDLPEVGAEVVADQPFGEVESTKSVSDVYSPVTGKTYRVGCEPDTSSNWLLCTSPDSSTIAVYYDYAR